MAREIVNRIQRTRKDLNFNVEDRIDATIKTNDVLKNVVEQHKDYIQKETLCSKIEFSDVVDDSIEHDVEGNKFFLLCSKSDD